MSAEETQMGLSRWTYSEICIHGEEDDKYSVFKSKHYSFDDVELTFFGVALFSTYQTSFSHRVHAINWRIPILQLFSGLPHELENRTMR